MIAGKIIQFRKGSVNNRRTLVLFSVLSLLIISSGLIFTSQGNISFGSPQKFDSNSEKIQYSIFKSMAGYETPTWIAKGAQNSYNDTSMLRYLGLDYIKKQVNVVAPIVIIFNQLVDYTHPELADVIDKVITIDNYGDLTEYPKEQLLTIDPHNFIFFLY